MKNKIFKHHNWKSLHVGAFLLLWLAVLPLQAQETFVPAGGNTTGNGGSVSYSVGQVFYKAHPSYEGAIYEGVQHAYEIFTVSVEEAVAGISLKIYPNPVQTDLTLQITNQATDHMRFEIFNTQGMLLEGHRITDSHTTIPMHHLPPATYLIKVWDQRKELKSFKIIKH